MKVVGLNYAIINFIILIPNVRPYAEPLAKSL